jgi:glucose-1-phosphate thymidylyltransferase
MKALILAAGYATRLYPLTLDKPKALLPVGSKTILDYIIDRMEELPELSEILIVTNEKFDSAFRQWQAGRACTKPLKIMNDGTVSDQDKLGAIGDIQLVIERERIEDDLFVLAGDNLFTFPLRGYVDYFHRVKRDCILVQDMEDQEELKRVGVVELDEGMTVRSFEEKPRHPKTNLGVFAMYIYRKETLPLFQAYLSEGNSPDAPSHFPEWLYARQEVKAYLAEGVIYDIGTHGAYKEVQEIFKR